MSPGREEWQPRAESALPDTASGAAPAFIYRARPPFHPLKLYCLLHSPWPEGLEAAGCFWIATRPDWMGEVRCSGNGVQYRACSVWWAALPRRSRLARSPWLEALQRDWHPIYGDRRQEIAFSGENIDQTRLARMLDECLVEPDTGASGHVADWALLPDLFPAWGHATA